jgi:hypothetical protein
MPKRRHRRKPRPHVATVPVRAIDQHPRRVAPRPVPLYVALARDGVCAPR